MLILLRMLRLNILKDSLFLSVEAKNRLKMQIFLEKNVTLQVELLCKLIR